MQSVPQIDGIIEENEWPDFQEILLPYWTTFKEGTIYGAEPWDTKDKICNYSIRSKNNHLYFCLQIPDNYIGENYTRAILSIYLDDHTQDFYDRKTIIWGDKEDIGIYQKNDYLSDGIHYRDNGDDYDTGPGGSLDIIAEYSHSGKGVPGADGIYTFEFNFPLKTITGDPRDADVGDLEISLSYSEWEKGWAQSSYWKIDPRYDKCIQYRMLPELVIDKIFSPKYANLGSFQILKYHLKWSNNNTDASGISMKVNDSIIVTNSTGWANLLVKNNEVGSVKYQINEIIGVPEFTIDDKIPEITWDLVDIIIPDVQRIDVGSTYHWVGRYLSNNQTFTGKIIANDTLSNHEIGIASYHVESVFDPLFGLTEFRANDFQVIYDRIEFNLSLVNSRISVGETPEIKVNGIYQYDSSPFIGEATITSPLNEVGSKMITVEGVTDYKFGLSTFQANEVECIWDRISITEAGASDYIANVGEGIIVWYKALFEYDSKPFTSDDGELYINDNSATWSQSNNRWELVVTSSSPTIQQYRVTSIVDEKYGITAITSNITDLEIEWKVPGIPGYDILSIFLGIGVYFLVKEDTHNDKL